MTIKLQTHLVDAMELHLLANYLDHRAAICRTADQPVTAQQFENASRQLRLVESVRHENARKHTNAH